MFFTLSKTNLGGREKKKRKQCLDIDRKGWRRISKDRAKFKKKKII